MNKKAMIAAAVVAAGLVAAAFAGWFGAKNYDECVLDSMKGATSDVAARAIMRSCREKFPKKEPTDAEVPAEVVSHLDGRGGMSQDSMGAGFFRGTIYNGNREWTITQLTFVLVAKNTANQSSPREYNGDVTVPPLTNSEFIFSADSDGSSEYEWGISKARGYKSR